MCTVTFIPTKNSFYLTSNREEHIARGKAIIPQKYIVDAGVEIVYSKDRDTGGSWIAIKNIADAAVLLNGAFLKYKAKLPYRKSRGLVLSAIIESVHPLEYFLEFDFTGIASFTVNIFSDNKLFEARWHGYEKHFCNLKTYKAYNWSSATLYDSKEKVTREPWFKEWLKNNPAPNQMDVGGFHRYIRDGDKETDLMVNTADEIATVSITSFKLSGQHSSLQYLDMISHTCYKDFLPLTAATQMEAVIYAA